MDKTHKAGFITLAGKPNVGKSTLLNSFLKFKLSIVSEKPQTTRNKILGILEGDDFQACFLDTPGIIDKPIDPLQQSLHHETSRAIRDDSDLILYMIDVTDKIDDKNDHAPHLGETPVILVLNKCDINLPPTRMKEIEEKYSALLKPLKIFHISALKGTGVEALKAEIIERLPECPPFYEKGQLSDRWERFFAAELIREHIFNLYYDEIPHATAVVIEQFREKPGKPDEIFATLFVERDSQKGIIIGKGGKDLGRLTDRAKASIENFLSRKINLELWVKVRKDWRKDKRSLKEFGYATRD